MLLLHVQRSMNSGMRMDLLEHLPGQELYCILEYHSMVPVYSKHLFILPSPHTHLDMEETGSDSKHNNSVFVVLV